MTEEEERPFTFSWGLEVPDFEEMFKRFLEDDYYGNQRYHLEEFRTAIWNLYARWLSGLTHDWTNALYYVIDKAEVEIPKGQVHRLAALGKRIGKRTMPVAKDMAERRTRYRKDLAAIAYMIWAKLESDELEGKTYLPYKLVLPADDELTALLKKHNKLKRAQAPRTQRLQTMPKDIKNFWT